MKKRALILLAIVVLVNCLALHGADTPDRAHQDSPNLKGESVAVSLKKLSDVNLFYLGHDMSGGYVVGLDIPLREDADKSDLAAIMRNRRFRKIYHELSRMDKAAASELVNREFADAIPEYVTMYDAQMLRLSPHFKLDQLAGKKGFSGPTFAIANVPEGEVVIAGARLKVLALVWTTGMLGLSSSKEQLERVARSALKQRTELYDDPTLHPFFKEQMLERASLYNRQIIGTGLLGVTVDGASEAPILKAVGAEWQQRQLTTYQSELTEDDLPGFLIGTKPDYSTGSLTVKFISPLNDVRFDILLKELHSLKPSGDQEK